MALYKYGLNDSLAKIQEIANLPKNWNGYESKPIPPLVIERATEVVKGLGALPQPFIAPTADQEIQLEWEKEDGLYLEVLIHGGNSKEYSVYFCQYRDYFDEGDYELAGTVERQQQSINNLVQRCFV